MPQLEYVLKGHISTHPASYHHGDPSSAQTGVAAKFILHGSVNAWAATMMCFFGFLRSGEVVSPSDTGFDPSIHLAYGDVTLSNHVNPSYLEVRISGSRPPGVTVILGWTDDELCPVAAITGYMV